MTEQELANAIAEALASLDGERAIRVAAGIPKGEVGPEVNDWRSYENAGLMTTNKGIVIEFDDGSRYQITVKQERERDTF